MLATDVRTFHQVFRHSAFRLDCLCCLPPRLRADGGIASPRASCFRFAAELSRFRRSHGGYARLSRPLRPASGSGKNPRPRFPFHFFLLPVGNFAGREKSLHNSSIACRGGRGGLPGRRARDSSRRSLLCAASRNLPLRPRHAVADRHASHLERIPRAPAPPACLAGPLELFHSTWSKRRFVMKVFRALVLVALFTLGIVGTANAASTSCCDSAECCASCSGC